MNPCELATTVTAIACAIAKCVPKEELPLLAAVFGQLASTLATITVQEDIISNSQTELIPTTPADIVISE
jgi:predicted component of type VI protein secretion system